MVGRESVGILYFYWDECFLYCSCENPYYRFYFNLIKQDTLQPQKTVIFVAVEHNSYLCNKEYKDVILPDGCTITHVIRDKKEIPTEPNLKIKEDDSIGIEVYSNEIEQLYRALVSYGEASNSV